MTVDQRMDRLERAVVKFIRSASEHSNEIRASIAAQNRNVDVLNRIAQDHVEILKTLSLAIRDHDAILKSHEAMIRRFDEWLRGQGPANGHKRRKNG
jgi:hypothetical protein